MKFPSYISIKLVLFFDCQAMAIKKLACHSRNVLGIHEVNRVGMLLIKPS